MCLAVYFRWFFGGYLATNSSWIPLDWHNENKDAHTSQMKNSYQQKKNKSNVTTNAQIRFKKFKEETMEGN